MQGGIGEAGMLTSYPKAPGSVIVYAWALKRLLHAMGPMYVPTKATWSPRVAIFEP